MMKYWSNQRERNLQQSGQVSNYPPYGIEVCGMRNRILLAIVVLVIYCLSVWISGVSIERGEIGLFLFLGSIASFIAAITCPFVDDLNNRK